MKGYEKYLPDRKDKKTVLIQAKINEDLHAQVKTLMDREGYTWHDIISGLLEKLVDDSRSKRTG